MKNGRNYGNMPGRRIYHHLQKKLRTTLLDKTNNIMKKECEDAIAEAETVTIVTDGWLNMRKDHLVNYIALIPNRKPLFYGNKDTTGLSQTSHQIAGDIIELIENIGQEKVVAVVSDNASNMRGAWTIIEQKYPSIFANGCAAQVLNLLIQDLCKLGNDEEVFIKYHPALATNFRNISEVAPIKKISVFTRCNVMVYSTRMLEQLSRE